MNEKEIAKLLVERAFAKTQRSDANGTKAVWAMDDQVDLAVEVIAQTVADEVEPTAIKAAVQNTYNHSATAQRLERLFAGTGHFVRVAKAPKESYESKILADLAAAAKGPAPAPAPAA